MSTVKETTVSKTTHRERFPTRALGTGVLITFLFVGGEAVLAWRSYQDLHEMVANALALRGLAGDLIRYDEILTMSASMAAATSNPEWEQRYRTYEPQMDRALDHAVRIAPELNLSHSSEAAAKANETLVDMEHRVFEFLRFAAHTGDRYRYSGPARRERGRQEQAVGLARFRLCGLETRASHRSRPPSGLFQRPQRQHVEHDPACETYPRKIPRERLCRGTGQRPAGACAIKRRFLPRQRRGGTRARYTLGREYGLYRRHAGIPLDTDLQGGPSRAVYRYRRGDPLFHPFLVRTRVSAAFRNRSQIPAPIAETPVT